MSRRREKCRHSRPIAAAMALLIFLGSTACWATRYDFVSPSQGYGEFTEVIFAFSDPATGGLYPDPGDPTNDAYSIAILDTGASANLVSMYTQGFDFMDFHFDGLDLPLLEDPPGTPVTVDIAGVGGAGWAYVSEPLTLQVNSSSYIADDVDFTGFPAEYNTQVVVCSPEGTPGVSMDIVGVPFVLDKWTVIYPQQRVASASFNILLLYDQMTAHVEFRERGDPSAPPCSEWINLSFPDGPRDNLDDPGNEPSAAASPSIEGLELAFGESVTSGSFIVDTGAQITLMATHIAEALGIDTENDPPDITQTIGGVTGDSVEVKGWFIDRLSLPTSDGDWLDYWGIPIYVLDIYADGELYTEGLLGSDLYHYEQGFETIFFDMQLGLMGLNHPDFTDEATLPFEVAAIPEPSAVLFMLTGIGVVALLQRRAARRTS